MLTKEELAAKLKVTVRTVENWQHAGHLPYVKIACMVRFHWPEVVEHLKANFKVCRRGVVRPRE
jgi:excisionase family DNA binding protein